MGSLSLTKESRALKYPLQAEGGANEPSTRMEMQMKFPLEPQRVERQQTARFAWFPVVARDKNHKRWIVWLRTVYLRWVATEKGHWEYVL